jgi:hypothetical protein
MVGGDITEVTYNHPNLGSGTILPKADESSTYDLGGLRSDDTDSGVDGGGNVIDIMSRKRWSLEFTAAWDMNVRSELEKVVAMAADPIPAKWTFTHINGTVYQGTGKPVGDLQGAGKESTFPLKISGGGTAKKING